MSMSNQPLWRGDQASSASLSHDPQSAELADAMSDFDVTLGLMLLAKSGKYRKLKPFLMAAQERMPSAAPEQIRRCTAAIGQRARYCEA